MQASAVHAKPPADADDYDDDEDEPFTLGIDRHGAPLDLGNGSLIARIARLKAAAAAGRVGGPQFDAELRRAVRAVAQANAAAEAVGGLSQFGCDGGHALERARCTSLNWR
jgi:hypothetical protein